MKKQNKTVSFDFDSTLNRHDITDFCKSLILKGIDVWVVTSRASEDDQPNWIINGVQSKRGNDDLFDLTDSLGIPRNQIIFTNHEFKSNYLPSGCIWHLDDDWTEIRDINTNTNIKGISQFGNKNWKQDCLSLL
jgi:hypothetical protein